MDVAVPYSIQGQFQHVQERFINHWSVSEPQHVIIFHYGLVTQMEFVVTCRKRRGIS